MDYCIWTLSKSMAYDTDTEEDLRLSMEPIVSKNINKKNK